MEIPNNNTVYLKCPYCPCIFFNKKDLDTHIKHFGNNPTLHINEYKEVNAKIEFGYGSEE